MNMYVDLILRWTHVSAGAVLAGGLFFLACVWLPSVRNHPGGAAAAMELFRGRWAKVVGVCTALLLITGVTNGVLNILRFDFDRPGYHAWVAIKLVAGLVLFTLAALVAGRTGLAQRLRQNLPTWLTWGVILALGLVMAGGYMRSIGRTPKSLPATADASIRP